MNISESSKCHIKSGPLFDPTNKSEDILRYSDFAKTVANYLTRLPCPNGYVIAINGEWGSGKTTFINYVEYYIWNCEFKSDYPIKKIIKFSPWRFSGSGQILRELFLKLGQGFNEKLKRINESTELIGEWIVSLTPFKDAYQDTIESIKNRIDPNKKTIEQLKQEIIDELPKNEKILVIIDDIDRLYPSEIAQLFQAIKSVADFPNVLYLVAFDEKIVSSALSQELEIKRGIKDKNEGKEYYEKIVQLSLSLPYPEKYSLKKLFFSEVESIIPSNSNLHRLHYVYDLYLSHILTTPRKIYITSSSLEIKYSNIIDEFNLTDIIILEILRLFYGSAYNFIRTNPDVLLYGNTDNNKFKTETINKELTDLIEDGILKEYKHSEKQIVIGLLKQLFPVVAYSNASDYEKNIGQFYKEKRICCDKESFLRYFRFEKRPDQLSEAEIKLWVSERYYQEKLPTIIKRLSSQDTLKKGSKIPEFLDKMSMSINSDIDEPSVEFLFRFFFKQGDDLLTSNNEPVEAIEKCDNRDTICIILANSLHLIRPEKRLKIVKNAISAGDSIGMIAYFIANAERQHHRFDKEQSLFGSEILLDLDQLRDLERFILENKYRGYFSQSTNQKNVSKYDFSLMGKPNINTILELWRVIDDGDSIKQYLQLYIKNNTAIGESLKTSVKYKYGIELSSLYPDIKTEEFEDVVKELVKNDPNIPIEKFVSKRNNV